MVQELSNMLTFKKTDSTPEIELTESKLVIEGVSIDTPHNVFDQILSTLKERINNVPVSFDVNLYLEYFNTSTANYLIQILQVVELFYIKTKATNVVWNYQSGDMDMLEVGKDLASIVTELPIKLLEVK